jgi:hypothetical protein
MNIVYIFVPLRILAQLSTPIETSTEITFSHTELLLCQESQSHSHNLLLLPHKLAHSLKWFQAKFS